jgi:branched-chain amino acid transport system substrate-binding protein
MAQPNRRDVLQKAGAGIVAGSLVGLSGCSDGGGGGGGGGDGDGDGGGGGGDGGSTGGGDSEPFKVGIMEPLSGPTAISGQEARNGSRLTADAINQNGGLNGREIELVVEDTEASPDTGVQRARSLIQQENVDIIHGVVSSAVAKAVVEFTSQQQVPFIGTATQTPDLNKEQCSRYTFRTTTNLIHQQRATAKMVADNIAGDGESVDVHGVNPDYVYGQQSWDVFRNVYPELNSAANITGSEFPAFLKGDYNQEIQAILDENPDIVHSSLYSGDMISFIQQAQQFDFFEQIDAFLAGVVPAEINIALGPEGTPDNLWSVVSTYIRWPEGNERLQTFNEEYRSRNDMPSEGEPTSFSYENAKAMRATQKAVEEAGSTNPEDIIDAMEGLRLDNAPAPPATIREGDHQAIADQLLTGPHGPISDYEYYGYEELQPVSGDFIADDVECSL